MKERQGIPSIKVRDLNRNLNNNKNPIIQFSSNRSIWRKTTEGKTKRGLLQHIPIPLFAPQKA
jgi:hypothetical protein